LGMAHACLSALNPFTILCIGTGDAPRRHYVGESNQLKHGSRRNSVCRSTALF
jgi:hypothetical protein